MNTTRKRLAYEASFKLQAIEHAEKTNNCAAAREFSVTEKLVRDWRKNKDILLLMPKNKKARRGKTKEECRLIHQKMSIVRRERSSRIRVPSQRNVFESEETSTRRRSAPPEKAEKDTGEASTPGGSGVGVSNIRTRLSTGTLHMNGTQTIKDAKLQQVSDDSNDSQKMAPAKDSPAVVGKKRIGVEPSQPPPKRRKIGNNDGSGERNKNDYFCWMCHKEGTVICCQLCPRVFHMKCLDMVTDVPPDWVCPECEKIMRAECVDSRSRAMAMISVDTLCFLLKFALERMKHSGCDPFLKAVDLSSVPHYSDYIFHPMDLTILEKNIKKKMYGCTEAFLADSKWILHNCIIFNGLHNKLTSAAKTIVKICRHEMSEIEVCPDCYLNSCVKKNDEWFCEPCREPHPLVWAKLKGYPFWQAKALRENNGLVDVRFFGAHDRSWVPTSQVFMLSKDIPTPMRNKRQAGFDNATDETNLHIEKIREKFGSFEYAPFRTPYDSTKTYSPMKKKKNVQGSPKKKSPQTNFQKASHSFNVMKRKTIDPKSSATKTASALRQKYSSISTRKTVTSNIKSPGASVKPELGLMAQDTALNVCGVAKLTEKEPQQDQEQEQDEPDVEEKEEVQGKRFDSSLLDKEVSSDEDSVNLLEDKVLDSSSSENMSPVRKGSALKETIEECHVRLGIADKTCELSVKNDEESLKKESDETKKDVEKTEIKSDKNTSKSEETAKAVEVSSETSTVESKSNQIVSKGAVADKSEAIVSEAAMEVDDQTSVDGRQTPTDSVDGEVVYTARGGVVSQCGVGDSHKQSTHSANVGKDQQVVDAGDSSDKTAEKEIVESPDKDSLCKTDKLPDKESGEHKNLETESVSETEKKIVDEEKNTVSEEEKKSMVEAEKSVEKECTDKNQDSSKTGKVEEEGDFEPSLMMEVETESDPDQLVIDTDSEQKNSPLKILTSSKKLTTNSVPDKNSSIDNSDNKPDEVSRPKDTPGEIPADKVITATKVSDNVNQTAVKTSVDIPATDDHEHLKVAMFTSKNSKTDQTVEKTSITSDMDTLDEDEDTTKKDDGDQSKTKAVIDKYKTKLMVAMKSTLDNMCADLEKTAAQGPVGSSKHYQLELEKLRWIHLQEVAELKHNFKLTVMEMRSAWDAEKQRLFKDISKLCEKEKNKAIAEIKKKQWCANCGKEAIYYCCWNTSYCTYECQQSNWPNHMPSCMQTLAASEEADKASQSKNGHGSTANGKEEQGKKATPPVSKQSEWTEKDEAIQAQRTFNLAPPTVSGPNSTPTTSPQTGAWRNRARDNLEQVLRRQEDPAPSQTVYIPPQIIPSPQQTTTAGFLPSGEAVIQYIQQPGAPQGQPVHLPPASLQNFSQPPQVRLQSYPGQQIPGPASSLLQNVSGYPVLRQQSPGQMGAPAPATFLPRNQIFLAPNAQNPRTQGNMALHYQIRPR